jgi:uncharacterized membrane protein (UPF0136 family)
MNEIVEATPPKICKSELNDPKRFGGRTITASRIEGIDLGPLFAAAEYYHEQGIPYGWGDLLVVGLVLLIKNPAALWDSRLRKAVRTFLTMAVSKRNKAMVQSRSSAMFCSQFVCQCFKDAKYVLEIYKPA